MSDYWVTTGSTNPEAVVNPLAAACDEGFVPDRVFLLENPGVRAHIDRIGELVETTVAAYGGESLDVEITSLDEETNFPAVVAHFRDATEAARAAGARVAVDVTPGRKFMSAIAFQAGIRYEADHVYYLYVESGSLFGRIYADLPRTATELYDFTEVF